jgi:uncharacterized protein YkwD
MKKIILKHKKFILLVTIISIIAISVYSISFGTEDYEKTDFEYAKVTASHLNVRRGPGISYQAVGLLNKGEYVRVFAKIGNWYVVQTEKNIIGTVYSDYVEPYTDYTEEPMQEESNLNLSSTISDTSKNSNTLETSIDNYLNTLSTSSESYTEALDTPLESYTQEELDFLNSINLERQKYGLQDLIIDSELENVARLKAEDLVKNNYFSHTSPTYGTLYQMLDSSNITYKTASENIAGNSSLEGAISALMNSDSHKGNILSNSFNYTGVAVVNSASYGKIFVQIFVGN